MKNGPEREALLNQLWIKPDAAIRLKDLYQIDVDGPELDRILVKAKEWSDQAEHTEERPPISFDAEMIAVTFDLVKTPIKATVQFEGKTNRKGGVREPRRGDRFLFVTRSHIARILSLTDSEIIFVADGYDASNTISREQFEADCILLEAR